MAGVRGFRWAALEWIEWIPAYAGMTLWVEGIVGTADAVDTLPIKGGGIPAIEFAEAYPTPCSITDLAS
ncbi:hypothetical protein GCM10007913_17640 [Devosia yakushimensis]|uniref:Uncharacterized protein n=1 Tax=Devosia yakushimensis TaxID=470028 RepID=A0ABQ5UCK6_9HYPH|nr:hypothetical protein GCM10007913_17640 [Devosia yakushimensis]